MLFTVNRGRSYADFRDMDIAVVDLDTGEHHVVVQDAVFARYVPGGHIVYVRQDGGLYVVPFDERELRVTGEPLPLPGNVMVEAGTAATFGVDLTVSASGTLAYVGRRAQGDDRRMVWVRRDGSTEEIDPGWTAPFVDVALSADESRLALVTGQINAHDTDIWILPLGGGGLSRLTFTDGLNYRPAWTPDDRSVTFVTDRDGSLDLYAKRADGSGSPEVVLDLPVDIDEGFWSKGGEWLILRVNPPSSHDIMAWRAGTPPEDLIPVATDPEADEQAPALSPDGHFIAYTSNESGRNEVWVRTFPDVDAGRWQVSLDGGVAPVWARNGRELFYKTGGNLVSVAVETDSTFSHGEEEVLFSTAGYRIGGHQSYDVTADGERFVTIRLPDPEVVVVENFLGEGR